MAAVDSQVVVAAIATGGGIITTLVTLRYKDYFAKKNTAKAPKDRMESIFDGYESLIKELKDDSERKTGIIDNLQTIVNAQREEIEKSQGLIDTLRREVSESKQHAEELKTQLDRMKADYVADKVQP